MDETRTHDLIDRYLDQSLGEDSRVVLERTLIDSPRARDAFWEKTEMHIALRCWARGHWGRVDAEALRQRHQQRWWRAPAWRPRIGFAAAVGACTLLAGSMLGAGVAWAIGAPIKVGRRIVLPVCNAGFEEPIDQRDEELETPPTTRALDALGTWTGDPVRVVSATNGIRPAEGSHMLVFERALSTGTPYSDMKAAACDIFQVVDLSMLRDEFASGNAMLELSARFLDDDPGRDATVAFNVRLYVYNDPPESIRERWPDAGLSVAAIQHNCIRGAEARTPEGWQRVSARVLVPPRARFAMLRISVSEDYPTERRATFGRQYCDDVQLRLFTSAIGASGPGETQE